MNLEQLRNGSYVDPSDTGEPSTGVRRVSITDEEGAILAELADGRRVLEIGTGLGVSTRWLARTAGQVVTHDIDHWVHDNVWPTLPPNVVTVDDRGDIVGRFDVVFIDGDHSKSALRADILFAESVLADDGVIVAHDATPLWGYGLFSGWERVETTHGLAIRRTGGE